MALPDNFNKYNPTITYFRNNGFDCLSSLQEQYRFWLRYGNHYRLDDYMDYKTSLLIEKYKGWGVYNYMSDCIDIKKLTLQSNIYPLENNIVTKEFLYDKLSEMKDSFIIKYFSELFARGDLRLLNKKEYLTIFNHFNESKIVIEKEIFEKYCVYNNLIVHCTDEKIINFTIDIEFNDNVSKNIILLLENKSIHTMSCQEFNQFLSVVDYLQINYIYK
jgi:hypothetical protein